MKRPQLPPSSKGTAQLVGLAFKIFSAKVMAAITEARTSVSDIENDFMSLFSEWPILYYFREVTRALYPSVRKNAITKVATG